MPRPGEHAGPDAPAHGASIGGAFAFKGYISRTEHRAITCSQLDLVAAFAAAECVKWSASGSALSFELLNLYHLNAWLIMPATKSENCAFVELLASRDQVPKWFVSHWWGETIRDFICCVKAHADVRGCYTSSTPYWVCAYANRQHSISDELSVDPQRTSFFKAMLLADGIVVVLDTNSTPFRRIWCMFEETVALNQPRDTHMLFDIATTSSCNERGHVLTDGPAYTDKFHKFDYLDGAFGFIGDRIPVEAPWLVHINKGVRETDFPIEIIRQGIQTRVVEAQASMPEDRRHILNYICKRGLDLPPLAAHAAYEEVDQKLRSTFVLAAWRQAAERRLVGAWSFPAILAADAARTRVALNFYHCETIDDASMAEVAEGLPSSLQELQLNNTGNLITNATISSIGAKFTPRLTRVDWYLAETAVDDAGLGVLAELLPAGLEELALSFRKTNVTDAGVTELARGLRSMTGLQRLLLFFYSTRLSNEGAAALAGHLPQTLESLTLNLFDTQVTDPAVVAIAQRLPGTVRCLNINLGGTAITDEALGALAAHLPAAVSQLTLVLNAARRVTDAGLSALASGMPCGLEKLVLHLQQTSVSDSGIAFFAEKLPSGVKRLELLVKGTAVSDLCTSAPARQLMKKVPILRTEQGPHITCVQSRLIRQCLQKMATSDGFIDLDDLGEVLQHLGVMPSEWGALVPHMPTKTGRRASIDELVEWLFTGRD